MSKAVLFCLRSMILTAVFFRPVRKLSLNTERKSDGDAKAAVNFCLSDFADIFGVGGGGDGGTGLGPGVSGLVVFAKTSKALARLNEMFRNSEVKKTYWAVVKNRPRESEGELVNYLVRNEKQNKSYAYDKEVPNSKKAILHYRLIARSQNYYLLEIDLKTGRHHQIRCQLAKMGCPIKGDLKYGSPRSNPDGSICLHARFVRFVHPVSKKLIEVEAPVPAGNLWNGFEMV